MNYWWWATATALLCYFLWKKLHLLQCIFFEKRERGNFQNYESELFHLLLASSQKFSLWQIAINHFQAYDSFSTIIFSNLLIIKSRNSHGKNNGLEAVNKQKMFTIEQWGKPFEKFFCWVLCCLWKPQLFFKLHCTLPWNGIFLYSVQCLINENVGSLLERLGNHFRKLEIWG